MDNYLSLLLWKLLIYRKQIVLQAFNSTVVYWSHLSIWSGVIVIYYVGEGDLQSRALNRLSHNGKMGIFLFHFQGKGTVFESKWHPWPTWPTKPFLRPRCSKRSNNVAQIFWLHSSCVSILLDILLPLLTVCNWIVLSAFRQQSPRTAILYYSTVRKQPN